jgi:hypothetical protein
MLERLFPRQVDNRFDGRRAAVWLLALLIGLKLMVSLNSILNTESVAESADGFPLASYGGDGARAVLMLFALGAVANLAMALFGVAVLLRWRALVPFVYLLSLLEHGGRRLVVESYAIERAQGMSGAGAINLAILALLLIGLGLSLWRREARAARTQTGGEAT